ncbi:Tektin-4 [Plecturocebus cupreus]
MAQTDVLLTKEPAPQTMPPCELPCKVSEVARNTGAYTSSGLATAGFRTAKYLLEEWFQNCQVRYHQAFADREQSEKQRHESQQLAAETQARAQRTQQDSTRRVGERLQDMHGWKSELQREVEALAAETDLLLAQKQRLERALDATEVPFSIATDNLQCRERRQHPNLVRDHVETELLKEAELIRNIQELLKRTIMQAASQIRLNREHKETCEMDWSDKVEAYNIDETCGRFHSQSTEVQSHPHSTSFQER